MLLIYSFMRIKWNWWRKCTAVPCDLYCGLKNNVYLRVASKCWTTIREWHPNLSVKMQTIFNMLTFRTFLRDFSLVFDFLKKKLAVSALIIIKTQGKIKVSMENKENIHLTRIVAWLDQFKNDCAISHKHYQSYFTSEIFRFWFDKSQKAGLKGKFIVASHGCGNS